MQPRAQVLKLRSFHSASTPYCYPQPGPGERVRGVRAADGHPLLPPGHQGPHPLPGGDLHHPLAVGHLRRYASGGVLIL